MEAVREWIVRYRQMLILLGVIGMMLVPFLWPFFLAIIFQVFYVAVPVIIVGISVKKMRREKTNEQKGSQRYQNTKDADVHFEETISGCKASTGAEKEKTAPAWERHRETGEESLRRQFKNRKEMSDASCFALIWYELEGKERIFRLMGKLEREGIRKFSISPEGICSVRAENGYRRIGVLRSYPCREMKSLIPRLKKDHIHASLRGKYLWLAWGKECFR